MILCHQPLMLWSATISGMGISNDYSKHAPRKNLENYRMYEVSIQESIISEEMGLTKLITSTKTTRYDIFLVNKGGNYHHGVGIVNFYFQRSLQNFLF